MTSREYLSEVEGREMSIELGIALPYYEVYNSLRLFPYVVRYNEL